uniref:UDP-glucose 4-epimerase n=1 Tax=Paenibacillus athensensis TaxID=1967502 RepID=A0A4Y8Q137_9BACL
MGSHIVDALAEAGHRVAVVDNFSTGKRNNVHPDAELYEVDIRNGDALAAAFAAACPEVVIHHAAQANVRTSIEQPLADADVNIIGSIQVLEMCRRYGTRKVIYASSAAVYGVPEFLGITEQHPVKPQSAYGISKHTVEHYLDVYAQLHGLDYTVLRYANVYGPRQDPHGEGGVVSIFVDNLLSGKQPVVYGDGQQTRDFVYVQDVVRANLAALHAGSRGVFNIGTNARTSVNELLVTLGRAFGRAIEPAYRDSRPGDIEHSRLDVALARERLGWEPTFTLLDGLAATSRR